MIGYVFVIRIDVRIVRSIVYLLPHGDAPRYCDATIGASLEISFLLFLLSRSARLLKHPTRGLNQPKKRPRQARIGRYLGLIGARKSSSQIKLSVSADFFARGEPVLPGVA